MWWLLKLSLVSLCTRVGPVGAFRPCRIAVYTRGPPPLSAAIPSAVQAAGPTDATLPLVEEEVVPWLIVGGGIHAVHIAARLLGEGVVASADQICIVDPNVRLLEEWKTRTSATGMEYLRSSAGFHLDLPEDSLRRFGAGDAGAATAGAPGRRDKKKRNANGKVSLPPSNFSNDYERPKLELFNEHCDLIVQQYKLEGRHARGIVTEIVPNDGHVRVCVGGVGGVGGAGGAGGGGGVPLKVYTASMVVLALGSDGPVYPEWASQEDVDSGTIRHLLDPAGGFDGFDDDGRRRAKRVAVVGGGITAAHKALELARDERSGRPDSRVHLISRHPLRESQFDTHQEWMMDGAWAKRSAAKGGKGTPKRQVRFAQTSSLEERRKTILKERVPGTVTAAVNRGKDGLQYAISKGDVRWHLADVTGLSTEGDGSKRLSLSCGSEVVVDEVLLATGFGKKPPGGALIEGLVHDSDLAVSEFCGYPVVDSDLKWHPRIHVMGALAELELGPSARNIAGARLAAERICSCWLAQ